MFARLDAIWEKFTEWLKEILVGGIMNNISGLFDNVNAKAADISGQVGATPQAWNSGIFSMIRSLSENVILTIAGVILAIIMTMELIQLITDRNNFKRLGVSAEPLNGYERLKLMHGMFHMDEQEPFHFSWDWLAPSGLSVKDFIAPSSFEFKNGSTFGIGNKIGTVSFLQILAKQLNISTHQLSYVTHSSEGEGLLFYGSIILPFVDRFPKDTELYKIMTTKPQEQAEGKENE